MFTARVLSGTCTLIGMIRANQPGNWHRTLESADRRSGSGVFALVTPDIWQLVRSRSLDPTRRSGWGRRGDHVALIVGAGLWSTRRIRSVESRWPSSTWLPRQRSCWVLSPLRRSPPARTADLTGPGAFTAVRGGPRAGGWVGDYMKLAWLTSSLATLGALGAGLESDESFGPPRTRTGRIG